MVQTFVIEETKDLIYDSENLDKWKKKCEDLGLTKQLSLSSPEKSPIPFQYMNTAQKRVYETLCPQSVQFGDYDKTPAITQPLILRLK